MEYHLKPLGKTCAATGAALRPGSICHSVVIEDGSDLQRLDFSEEGWTGPPDGTIAHWKNVVPQPVEVRKKLLDPDALMAYFDQLSEEANPLHEKLRYILAILLLRKKRFRLDDSRQEGDDEILQLVSTQGEGVYEVRDLQLTETEMLELQQTLNAHLAAEWSPS